MNKKNLFTVASVLSLNLMLGAATYASPGDGKVAMFIGDHQFTMNAIDLNSRAGTSAAPKNQPWSGTFWPLRSGSTGNAYAEHTGFKINQWIGTESNLKKFQKRMSKLRSQLKENRLDASTINNMAPSEKYDLYIGDYDFSFTVAEWQSVSEQDEYIGQISLWEGSCHGWATAAIYEDRPARAINVMSLDGRYMIPFYPHDLKALSTRLWANSLVQDHTVWQGQRCKQKDPKKDPLTGKVLDDDCKGVNPGDFHVSVLEMVGARKESFVVNRSNTRQVWNQPVAGYELNYFNPISERDGGITQSIVSRAAYLDPYYNFRSKNAKSILGVEMKLRYISETKPDHSKKDGNDDDKVKTLKLRYDLELDENNQIVGGEWRNKSDPTVTENGNADGYNDETADIPKFPGFLWKFEQTHPIAFSIADFDLMGDDPTQMDRTMLVAASGKAANFRYLVFNYDKDGYSTTIKREELRPQPLGKVVNYLVNLAK